MNQAVRTIRARLAAVGLVAALAAGPLAAQPPGGFGPPPERPPAREAAPVDLTGYWVSLVTEDWIERMSPDSPPSGTGRGFGGRGRGNGPPPAPATNPDDPCRVYGAAGSLRVPGRLHISWIDDDTLGVEMDAGSQQRVFHFDPSGPSPSEKTLQGYSVASWETGNAGRGPGGFGPPGGAPSEPPSWGSLKVVTTNLTGGYLLSTRSNYGDDTTLTEYFTYHDDFGHEYFTVTAVIEEGGSLRTTSSTFKKEPDGSKFDPSGCEIYR